MSGLTTIGAVSKRFLKKRGEAALLLCFTGCRYDSVSNHLYILFVQWQGKEG
jgi:hypothetical protein